MRGDRLQSDVLDLYRTYDAPPEGFDPRKATDKELVHHGFPRRPDAETEPELDRLWKRAFARQTSFVKAELEIDPVMSKRDPLRGRGSEFGPSGWGGAAVDRFELGLKDPTTIVFGQWVVPEVVPFEPLLSGDITAGFWVGLDGLTNNQVLQAGIAVTLTPEYWVSPYTNVNWWAWTEWYTEKYQDPAVAVMNFPVATGNTVFFVVCAPQPDFGYVSMLNVSTGHGTSVGINARPGITSKGDTAEWIVEGISDELPAFYPVTFNDCTAGTRNDVFNLSPDGLVTEIQGSGGEPITKTQIASPQSAVVYWEAWS